MPYRHRYPGWCQLDCVGCTACIDACDEVMDKVGFPKGLIRYASENQIANGTAFRFTTKMKAYTALLFILLVVMSVMIVTRKTVDTYISRVKGQLYQEVDGGKLSNLFEAKILNKTNKEIPVELKVEGISGEIKLVGGQQFLLKKEAINDYNFSWRFQRVKYGSEAAILLSAFIQKGERYSP